jgi:hypothetical protein
VNIREDLNNRIAAAIAHRACCGVEQNLPNGKLHGYCVVCGVPWPCETAQSFIFKPVHIQECSDYENCVNLLSDNKPLPCKHCIDERIF